MKTLESALFALALTAPAATAQTGSQPTVVLTIFGGMARGNSLWDVARQPFCQLQGSGSVQSCSSLYDTLRLTRHIARSLILGAVGTYFPGAHFGYTFELSYIGLPPDDRCTGLFYNSDTRGDTVSGPRNAQLCRNLSAASLSLSAIALFAALTARAASEHSFSPYLRGGVGLVTYTAGTVEMSGLYADSGRIRSRSVYIDDNPRRTAISGQIAGGSTFRFKPGYQVRLEVRDVIIPLPRVTGPSDNLLRPPTRTRLFHHVALTAGLDVVLEKKHGRRY